MVVRSPEVRAHCPVVGDEQLEIGPELDSVDGRRILADQSEGVQDEPRSQSTFRFKECDSHAASGTMRPPSTTSRTSARCQTQSLWLTKMTCSKPPRCSAFRNIST